jgi:hypothetical protein
MGKWELWCNQWNLNPLQPTCNQLVNYLSELAENNYSYNTINAYKAAITQTLSVSGNFSFHLNPLMIRFMKGVFLNNRPKPKYTSTWDVGKVLSYLKSLYPLEKLDIKSYFEIGIPDCFNNCPKSSDIDFIEYKKYV